MHARFWRSLPGCFSMSFSIVSFPVFSLSFHEMTRRNSGATRCLAFAARNLPRCPETRLNDRKIAKQNRQQYDSSDPKATCKPGSFTACSFWRFLAIRIIFAGKTCVLVGTNNYTCVFFFRWKLLIVTDCLIESSLKVFCLDMNQFALNSPQFISIPSPPCKDVEDLPEMMVFDLDGAHLAAIRFSNLLSIWQVGVS